MNANVFITKDYENETALRPKKTNPNKANLKRALFSTKTGNFACRLHSLNRTCACVSLDLVFARKPGGAGRCERKPKLHSSEEKAGEFAYLDIFFNLLNGELAFRDIIRAYFQESCLKFAENSVKNVKFGKSVTFDITDGT